MSKELKKSKVKGISQLAASLIAVWGVTFYVLPAITSSSDSIQGLADYIDETGIETGNFYYTSVEIVSHADMNARSTIEYFADRPKRIAAIQKNSAIVGE
ncbi:MULTISPECIES: hypothetical protein [Desulfosediminicola]|uniref:hypothetical protein n=1 Tax=Desulfosediminicola TaxID=2886823 RepID=UPI0010AD4751|nr:hypothetical protein [Desulfosediminicola ganghwensis]